MFLTFSNSSYKRSPSNAKIQRMTGLAFVHI